MEVEAAPRKRKNYLWILAIAAVALIAAGIWTTHEPASPFSFLNKYEVAEQRTSKDGKLRILVLKADPGDIWKAITNHFSGDRVFTSSGYMNVNGLSTQYMSLATKDGLIKVSDDLSFADEGFATTMQSQDVKPGYCAVAFTRPATVFDKILEWIHTHMGGKSSEPPRQEYSPGPPTIRV